MATTQDRLPAVDASGATDDGHSDAGAGEHARSPWVGIDPQVDPVRWARLLRRAHELALSKGRPPSILRDVVASSWTRAARAGVDPDGPAPKMLDAPETAQALAQHPVSHLLPLIEGMLSEATEEARYFAVLSDAEGVLLWAGGHPEALQIAIAPGFLPGHLCSEGAVGTNAVGTALELDHPVQIFSAEHFNRRLHGWTCSAAPIHDPETHEILGVLDLSGSFRTGHPHSLSLVAAVARVVEDRLAAERARRDERLKALYTERIARGVCERTALVTQAGRVLAASPRGWLGSRIRLPQGERLTLPSGEHVHAEPIRGTADAILLRAGRRAGRPAKPKLAVHALGRRRALVELGGESFELSPRHSEIVVLLAAHPEGLTSRELARELYGPGGKRVTVRAEMSRLRRLLGLILARSPYRLAAVVSADPEVLERVREGREG
ncbi:MAG: GAF domain-containing protein [Solirubrobacterales bacterium]